ncbi:MAG: condensation domain-containing protein, partial [Promethearchaeota archaeon]
MQLESIQNKKFERKLNSFERRFFRAPNQIISLVARVKGLISEEDLRIALGKVRQQHPLLGVRTYLDENNDAWFTTDDVPITQLKIIQRTSKNDWERELSREYNIRFELGTGPLARYVLVQSKEISEIIIVCHHIICD